MIEFNINEINWKEYKYPGFKKGDLLYNPITNQYVHCRDIATAKELNLEEDIPYNYTFISIDNPYGFEGYIWTNPELFELCHPPQFTISTSDMKEVIVDNADGWMHINNHINIEF